MYIMHNIFDVFKIRKTKEVTNVTESFVVSNVPKFVDLLSSFMLD